MDRAILKMMGISAIGEALSKLKHAREHSTQIIYAKAPSAKLPQIHFEMKPQQIRQFWIDWEVFTRMTDMPIPQTNIQLHIFADDSVQNTIINTYPKLFTTDPDRLQEMIEASVTQKSYPMVHQITFTSMSQHEDEPIQQYLVRLRATATKCNFYDPAVRLFVPIVGIEPAASRWFHWKTLSNHIPDLSDIYLTDQFIRGMENNALQIEILVWRWRTWAFEARTNVSGLSKGNRYGCREHIWRGEISNQREVMYMYAN